MSEERATRDQDLEVDKKTCRDKQAALAALGRLQEKSKQAMNQQGVAEADVDRELQD